jgi:predicted RNA binding protein with dsRBD fold (UPF0201 family)
MSNKIKSVEKGCGDNSIFFTINKKAAKFCQVDEIKEEIKIIGKGIYNDLEIQVYRGYKNNKLVFEMGQGYDVTITLDI